MLFTRLVSLIARAPPSPTPLSPRSSQVTVLFTRNASAIARAPPSPTLLSPRSSEVTVLFTRNASEIARAPPVLRPLPRHCRQGRAKSPCYSRAMHLQLPVLRPQYCPLPGNCLNPRAGMPVCDPALLVMNGLQVCKFCSPSILLRISPKETLSA